MNNYATDTKSLGTRTGTGLHLSRMLLVWLLSTNRPKRDGGVGGVVGSHLGGRNCVGRFSPNDILLSNSQGARVWSSVRFSRARHWSVKSLLRLVPNGLGSGGTRRGCGRDYR